tara:strand:- start:44 stop:1168 length:1125 start_codon:yes stop_codon:yes gene_type:complete
MGNIKSLFYVTYQSFPADTANSIQTISNIKYFLKNGIDVTLFFPLREKNSSDDLGIIKNKYSINRDFKIVGKTHNLPFGKIKFFNSLFFLISHYLWAKKTVIDLLESQDEPDVYFTRSDWVFYFLSIEKKNVIFELHQYSKLRKILINKALIYKNAKIIFLNENLYRDFENKNALQGRYAILQNGVDFEKFENNVNKNKNEIVFLGRLTRFNDSRNIDFIVDSLLKIKNDYKLKIVGATNQEINTFKKLYKTKFVEEKVTFYNQLTHHEAIEHLKSAEIGLLMNSSLNSHSIKYTSPLKYFEYLAAGLKIIAVDFDAHQKLPYSENINFFKDRDFESFKLAIDEISNYKAIGIENLNEISLDHRVKNIIKLAEI